MNNPQNRLKRPLTQVSEEPITSKFVVVGEAPAIQKHIIEESTRNLLAAIGEDPERDGLLKTPDRVARMWEEVTSGYSTDPEKLINGALFDVEYDEMVLVKDIEFYSLCEHHLLPFFGRAHVAYIPNGKVIGLSKIPRIVEMFARRLQVQERMTAQIAKFLRDTLGASGVAVVVEGSHMCAMMRGVKKPETNMTTSSYLGTFKEDRALRKEFLDQVNRPYHRD
ncbi:MAG: GTP cyclohydrolase I FolE [Anaerolineae bacterium]|nr:GTP cyclohydrolase I FolE [Anaerolineae bacterium]